MSVLASLAIASGVLAARAESRSYAPPAVVSEAARKQPIRALRTAERAVRASSPAPVHEVMAAEGDHPGAIVHGPRAGDGARPLVSVLHGMCGAPERECPLYESAIGARDWLLCPRASVRCAGGGSSFGWQDVEGQVERSVARVAARWPDLVDADDRVLAGFSLGALRAMDIAHRGGGGRYRGVILIGAKVYPDARKLLDAGVARVVLAAGEHDMMKWHMVEQTRRLVRRGYPAAFLSLGPVGHEYPADFASRFSRMLAWVRGDDSAFSPTEPGELALGAR